MPTTTRSSSRSSRDPHSPASSITSDTIVVLAAAPHTAPSSTPINVGHGRSTRSSSRRLGTPGPEDTHSHAHAQSTTTTTMTKHPPPPPSLSLGNEHNLITPLRRSLRSSGVTPIGSPLNSPLHSSSSSSGHQSGKKPSSSSTTTAGTTANGSASKTKTRSKTVSLDPEPVVEGQREGEGKSEQALESTPSKTPTKLKSGTKTPTETHTASEPTISRPDSARSTMTMMDKTDSMITDDLLGGHSPTPTPTPTATPTHLPDVGSERGQFTHHRKTSLDLLVQDSEMILGETKDELELDWEEEDREGVLGRMRSHVAVHPHGHGQGREKGGEVVGEDEGGDDNGQEVEVEEEGETTPRALEVVLEEDVDDNDNDEDEDEAQAGSLPVGLDQIASLVADESDEEQASDSASSRSSEEESESEESEDESEDDDDESDDDDDDPDRFLSRALESARQSSSKSNPDVSPAQPDQEGVNVAVDKTTNDEDEEEDVWMLDPDAKARESKRRRERPIPGLTIPKISAGITLHNLSLGPQDRLGKKRAQREERRRVQAAEVEAAAAEVEARGTAMGVKGKGKVRQSLEDVVKRGVEMDNVKFEKPLSRKEKLKLPPRKTASQAWSSLPTIPSALLPQMRKDYQAMHLRDSLDPKRFMKGKIKSTVPENFAIGTLIAPPRHLQSTTLTRERTYNPGDIVRSIVTDAELGGYAKRKFDDFAGKRMEHGKGKGWKKRKGEGW